VTEDDGKKSEIEFNLQVIPFSEQLSILRNSGLRDVDPKAVSAEIRKHGVSQLPEELKTWLCAFLDNNIETRGRKGHSDIENKLLGLHARLLYRGVRASQKNAADAPPEISELIAELKPETAKSSSKSEAAWMVVSYMMEGNTGHHKKISNLAGSATSKVKKTARK